MFCFISTISITFKNEKVTYVSLFMFKNGANNDFNVINFTIWCMNDQILKLISLKSENVTICG